ncbi:MAG: hypothetical protein RAO94_11770 [Candidatus Stygibacter australis]|nr:hypothetical protein [Candidatus Stygibacter australis]MDP8323019.1 hypothetical protein [Candidatus Stygibacter australis]
MIKNTYIAILLLFSVFVFADWPNQIGPEHYQFPDSVHLRWSNTNK